MRRSHRGSIVVCHSVPDELVTLRSRGIADIAVVDRQMQRHRAVATILIGSSKEVTDFLRHGHIDVFIPTVAIASHSIGVATAWLVYRQLQGGHGVTSFGRHQRIFIDTRLIKILVLEVHAFSLADVALQQLRLGGLAANAHRPHLRSTSASEADSIGARPCPVAVMG